MQCAQCNECIHRSYAHTMSCMVQYTVHVHQYRHIIRNSILQLSQIVEHWYWYWHNTRYLSIYQSIYLLIVNTDTCTVHRYSPMSCYSTDTDTVIDTDTDAACKLSHIMHIMLWWSLMYAHCALKHNEMCITCIQSPETKTETATATVHKLHLVTRNAYTWTPILFERL